MAQVLLHISDTNLILSRLFKLLKNDGHLIIVDFDKNEKIVSELVHNGFNQRELREMMIKIGFKNVQSKTFYNGKLIFMKQDASMFILEACK